MKNISRCFALLLALFALSSEIVQAETIGYVSYIYQGTDNLTLFGVTVSPGDVRYFSIPTNSTMAVGVSDAAAAVQQIRLGGNGGASGYVVRSITTP